MYVDKLGEERPIPSEFQEHSSTYGWCKSYSIKSLGQTPGETPWSKCEFESYVWKSHPMFLEVYQLT